MDMPRPRAGLTPAQIESGVGDSLRRLQVDHIDLYYTHNDDTNAPQQSIDACNLTVVIVGEGVDRNQNTLLPECLDDFVVDTDGMLIKAQLVSKIAEVIKRKGLTQTEAGELLGIPQPKLSNPL